MAINLRDYSRTAAQRGWGVGWPSCNGVRAAGTAVVSADRSGTRISAHKRLARLVDLLIDTTEARGYLLKTGQCGGYNCRAISGTNTASNHSWGLAVDINWQENPYTTNPQARTVPAWMPQLWNRYGFAWGGDYTGGRWDFMHFEFMGTPEQADQMTALALAELTGASAPPATRARVEEDCAMYIKCQPDPKKPVWVALLSGPMFVGLGGGELASAESEIQRGAGVQWVTEATWRELDRRSHALCDNPRPVTVVDNAPD